MRKIIQISLLLGAVACAMPSVAMFAFMPLRQVITQSDVIVVGVLRAVEVKHINTMDVSRGRLDVERVVWGNVRTGESLIVEWRNVHNVACRIEYGGTAGRRMIWFAKRGGDGVLELDHPQCVMPVDDLDTVLDSLAAYPYFVESPGVGVGEPVDIHIVFRNTATRPVDMPRVVMRDGRIAHSPGFRFEWQGHPGAVSASPWPADAIRADSTLQPVRLEPGGEVTCTLRVSDVMRLPTSLYHFRVGVEGRATGHAVHVLTVEDLERERVMGTPDEAPYWLLQMRRDPQHRISALWMLASFAPDALTPHAHELMALADTLSERHELMMLMNVIGNLRLDVAERFDYFVQYVDHANPRRTVALEQVGYLVRDPAMSSRRAETVYVLMELLADSDPGVRSAAANALGGVGPDAASALPALEASMSLEPDQSVRWATARAIDQILGRKRNGCE